VQVKFEVRSFECIGFLRQGSTIYAHADTDTRVKHYNCQCSLRSLGGTHALKCIEQTVWSCWTLTSTVTLTTRSSSNLIAPSSTFIVQVRRLHYLLHVVASVFFLHPGRLPNRYERCSITTFSCCIVVLVVVIGFSKA